MAMMGRPARADNDRILILVEMQGGNDGLNTLVPYADPLYRQLRPRIALAREQVIQLDERLGLHPALEPLLPLWRIGRMAAVAGLGYAGANRSHFMGIAEWDTARAIDVNGAGIGWVTRALDHIGARGPSDGVVLGRPHLGPLDGSPRTLMVDDPLRVARAGRAIPLPGGIGPTPQLQHVLAVQQSLRQAGDALAERLATVELPAVEFSASRFGDQMRAALRLILSGAPVRAIKVSIGSFDTHAIQPGIHNLLLGILARDLANFAGVLMARGAWERVMILTYSEFGRRAHENTAGGTDHGLAAAQFALGGGVRGGLYGVQPRLDDLDDGDVKYTTDFRAYYATALEWWGCAPGPVLGPGHLPLRFA